MGLSDLCKALSQKAVGSKLTDYNLDIVALQKVRWIKGGSQPPDTYMLFY
jgi:hypothetical protein